MKRYKINETLHVSGVVSFPDEKKVLKSCRDIAPHWNMEDIAKYVLHSYTQCNQFVEGVGEYGKDFEIDDLSWEWSEL